MDRGYTLPPEGKRNLFESIPQGSGFRKLPLAHIHALLNRLHSAALLDGRTAVLSEQVVEDQVLRESIERKVPRETFQQRMDALRKDLERIHSVTREPRSCRHQ